MNKKEKNLEDEQVLWDKHLKAIEIARALVREEAVQWREEVGLSEGEHTGPSMAMEMQLFAMSLQAPMSAGAIDTVEFFCEQTGVDFSNIMEIINNAISYGRAVVEYAEDSDGHT
jgi:hypothetical protein